MPTVFAASGLLPVLAYIHTLINVYRYDDITIDFSKSTRVLESGMLPLIPIINYHMTNGIKFQLGMPKSDQLCQTFKISNWAHFIDPFKYEFYGGPSAAHCPVIRFSNEAEQYAAVNKIMQIILSATLISPDALQAIEWSLNEITDNVLNHAGNNVSGFVQATWFRGNNIVEFVVADAGIGIPASLREPDQRIALERSVQEGVTRNPKTNQGNGLFGSLRIAQSADGVFSLLSQNASLMLTQSGDLKIREGRLPYKGTSVLWNINAADEDILSRALVFKGKAHVPNYSYLEQI